MRRAMLAAGVALSLLSGGAALAHEHGSDSATVVAPDQSPQGELRDEKMRIEPNGRMEHSRRIHRYAFNLAGGRYDGNALCNGGTVTNVDEYRDGADWAATVLSAFWYTPKHVKVTCSNASSSTADIGTTRF